MMGCEVPEIIDNKLDLAKIVYYIYMNVSEASITDVYFYPNKSIHIDVVYGGDNDFLVIDETGLVIKDNSFFRSFIQKLISNKTTINSDLKQFLEWSIHKNADIEITKRGLRISF